MGVKGNETRTEIDVITTSSGGGRSVINECVFSLVKNEISHNYCWGKMLVSVNIQNTNLI